ncbi:hypothetical protein [Actinoplanes sp. NPDC020271]|uniref:hypothetical protein n=1 Tax=Actinoplanes sp. NPDC020271 TaxID=3363896 RepID=UPI0037BD4B75
MTLLHDVLDPVELTEAVGTGLIRTQRHPRLPFTIYHCTEARRYSGAWSPVTPAYRGLIVSSGGRIVARTVWAVLATGGSRDVLLEPLPDEFHVWARGVAERLTTEVDSRAAAVEAAYDELVAGLPAGWGRKKFALAAVRSPHRGELFQRLDGHDYRPGLWQRARPPVDVAVRGAGE